MKFEEWLVEHFITYAKETKEDIVDVIGGYDYIVLIKPDEKLEICFREGIAYAGRSPLGYTTTLMLGESAIQVPAAASYEEPEFIQKIETIIREF